jgi:hypothetical protein
LATSCYKKERYAAATSNEVPPVSQQQDPRRPSDSNLSVAIAGAVAIIATAAILYISGMFN